MVILSGAEFGLLARSSTTGGRVLTPRPAAGPRRGPRRRRPRHRPSDQPPAHRKLGRRARMPELIKTVRNSATSWPPPAFEDRDRSSRSAAGPGLCRSTPWRDGCSWSFWWEPSCRRRRRWLSVADFAAAGRRRADRRRRPGSLRALAVLPSDRASARRTVRATSVSAPRTSRSGSRRPARAKILGSGPRLGLSRASPPARPRVLRRPPPLDPRPQLPSQAVRVGPGSACRPARDRAGPSSCGSRRPTAGS